jgi:hypothetical protein
MKVVAVLFVALAAVSAFALTHHNVLMMMDDEVFLTSKGCRELTEVIFYGTQQPAADYAMEVAGNGHGVFEVPFSRLGRIAQCRIGLGRIKKEERSVRASG